MSTTHIKDINAPGCSKYARPLIPPPPRICRIRPSERPLTPGCKRELFPEIKITVWTNQGRKWVRKTESFRVNPTISKSSRKRRVVLQ